MSGTHIAHEPHYTPIELAALWKISPQMVRKIFQEELGVLLQGEPSGRVGRKLKRSYFTMRIPYSVAERVHACRATKPRPRV
jgi:hypothetical protein